MLRQENSYVGVYGVILMNNDNCKLAERPGVFEGEIIA